MSGIGAAWKLIIFLTVTMGAQIGALAYRQYAAKEEEVVEEMNYSTSDSCSPGTECFGSDKMVDAMAMMWVTNVMNSFELEKEYQLPSDRDISIRMRVTDCDSSVCGPVLKKIRRRIIERLADQMQYDNLEDAETYWTIQVLMGKPVPTADQVTLGSKNGLREGACSPGYVPTSRSPFETCHYRVESLITKLNNIKESKLSFDDIVKMNLCKGDGCNPSIKDSLKKELGLPTISLTPAEALALSESSPGQNPDVPKPVLFDSITAESTPTETKSTV